MIYSKKDRTVDAPKGHLFSEFLEDKCKDGLGPYSFMRDCDRPTDSQINGGFGAPVKPVGLIVSAFRPSDDATQ